MTAPRTIGIGILGFGTVGQGVWKHLQDKQADLESRLGVKLDLRKASVRDLKKKRAVRIPASKLTTDANEIIDDPKVHVVCELIGGTTKARELTLRALRLGKVVVSANKALLCEHGPEIMQAVRQHGGQFLFEASVAGGIPIIKAIREGLVANRFELIVGILNGTCNHILTRMGELGVHIERGCVCFDPTLLKRHEFFEKPHSFEYIDLEGGSQSWLLGPGSLAFTIFQVPVCYVLGDEDMITLRLSDGGSVRIEGRLVPAEESSALFARNGLIRSIVVTISKTLQ